MSPPAYSLRAAGADDLPRLLEIHEAAFRPLVETRFDWDPAAQEAIVGESVAASELVLVAERVVGQLILEDRGEELHINRIMLDPEVQGRGLGRRIVEDVLADAAARGVPTTLSVWENNRARRLYERLGFRCVEQAGFRVRMRLDPPAP